MKITKIIIIITKIVEVFLVNFGRYMLAYTDFMKTCFPISGVRV